MTVDYFLCTFDEYQSCLIYINANWRQDDDPDGNCIHSVDSIRTLVSLNYYTGKTLVSGAVEDLSKATRFSRDMAEWWLSVKLRHGNIDWHIVADHELKNFLALMQVFSV